MAAMDYPPMVVVVQRQGVADLAHAASSLQWWLPASTPHSIAHRAEVFTEAEDLGAEL
jgi:hypothetical protein